MNSHHHFTFGAPRALTLAVAASVLSACGGGHSGADAAAIKSVAAATEIAQEHLCQVSSWRVAHDCSPGQKIAFLPESWGNEQLPVMFAALNCDMRYQVVSTKGAVVCIFRPIQPEAAKPAASAPAAGDSGASH